MKNEKHVCNLQLQPIYRNSHVIVRLILGGMTACSAVMQSYENVKLHTIFLIVWL